MISLRLDTTQFNKTFRDAVAYANGFLEGVERNKTQFNTQLGLLTVEILGKFIDSRARARPESLHHVYEWERVGSESSRLFEFSSIPTQRSIKIIGGFLPSNSVSPSSDEPFIDKANVMENRIAIEIEPRISNVLVFEDSGETVFTANSIYIANPGGDEVAGAFGQTVDEFFSFYFTNSVLSNVMKDLAIADEFSERFVQGANGGGRSVGITAGKKYLRMDGMILS